MARSTDMSDVWLFHASCLSFNWQLWVCISWCGRMKRYPWSVFYELAEPFCPMRYRQGATKRLTVTCLSVLPRSSRLFFSWGINECMNEWRDRQMEGENDDYVEEVLTQICLSISVGRPPLRRHQYFRAWQDPQNIVERSPLAGCTINSQHRCVWVCACALVCVS